ncbi:MAG: hypothetical protein ABSD67_17850 [Terracidiphilus sp.]
MAKATVDVVFTWCRPGTPEKPRGYEWKRKGGTWRGRQYLVPLFGAKGEWTEYVPHPGLFRAFASLGDNTSDETLLIKSFAKAYGDIIARPEDDRLRLTTVVEIIRKNATLETWCRAIEHMRRAVVLWDRINAPGGQDEMQRLFTRPKGASAILYWRAHHPLERKSDNTTCPALVMGKDVAKYPVGQIVPLARKALQYEIQSAFTDTETPSHTTACIVTPDLHLALRPTNLLAFMWLCFARVVSGVIEERRCEMFESCGEYIYVGRGPGLQRNDTITCSAACRQEKKRQTPKSS